MNTITVTRKLGFGLAAIIVAAGVSVSAPAQAQDNKQRVALMKELGKNLGPIAKTMKGEMAADYAAMSTSAAKIRDNSKLLTDLFPAGSGGGETRALPAIWEKNDEFQGYFRKLIDAADAFSKEAATGKMANLKASFGAMASNCGGCHKNFRAEKKK